MKHQKTIEQNVINFIEKNNLLFGAKKILIGLSGGADSIFALHFFYKFKQKYKIELSALHVNHSLRGKESDRDEKFCKTICNNLNVEFISAKVDVNEFAKKEKKSVEEAARILRYKEFSKAAKKNKADLIITAHNINDNTETVLLNIVNGSGIKGISGIPVKRENIIRPFLCLSKEEIKNYLISKKIDFVEDSSNTNVEFRRNFLRAEIIPLLKKNINPAIDKVILNSSQILRNQIKMQDFLLSKITSEILDVKNEEIIISVKKLNEYPEEIWGEIFNKIISENLSIDYTYNIFEKLKNLINSQVGKSANLGQNILVSNERNKLVFVKTERKTHSVFIQIKIGEKKDFNGNDIKISNYRKKPDFSNDNKIEYISGDLLSTEFILRNWEMGDKIKLLGMKGTKKISDVLTDLKVPTYKRKNEYVLLNNNEVVWLVGRKISEKFKVTSKTKKIIKLCLS